METYKYVCNECRYKTNVKSRWEAHIKTELHKTGTRKKRKDIKEPFKCKKCEYETKNKTLLKQHKLNEHGTIEERKEKFKYYCEVCDFGTFSIDIFNKHNNTRKHKKFIERRKEN